MGEAFDDKQRILQLIRESDAPLSSKQVCKTILGSSGKKSIELVQKNLLDLKISGSIFEFPPERAGYEIRFGKVSPTDWLSNKIVTMVKKAGGRLTVTQVRNSLQKWEVGHFDESIGRLVKEGKIFYLTVRFKYLLSAPPSPFDHLLPRQVTAAREILERINRHRQRHLSMEELRTFLDGLADQTAAPTSGSLELTEELLHTWHEQDLPKRGGLTSIPIHWTWSHYEGSCKSGKVKPNLDYFQDFLRNLHRSGKIELIPHSMTQEIPKREMEISLRSQHNEVLYYWKWR